MKKKGKKSLALAMTLAVTVTSVPPVYAADTAHTPMILPELSDGETRKQFPGSMRSWIRLR